MHWTHFAIETSADAICPCPFAVGQLQLQQSSVVWLSAPVSAEAIRCSAYQTQIQAMRVVQVEAGAIVEVIHYICCTTSCGGNALSCLQQLGSGSQHHQDKDRVDSQ